MKRKPAKGIALDLRIQGSTLDAHCARTHIQQVEGLDSLDCKAKSARAEISKRVQTSMAATRIQTHLKRKFGKQDGILVICTTNLSANEFQILLHLSRKSNLSAASKQSAPEIAKACDVRESTVRKALKRLVSIGMIDMAARSLSRMATFIPALSRKSLSGATGRTPYYKPA